jgi:dTDP-4-dehydrorhamnose reductase
MHYLIVGRGWTGNKMFNELVNRGHIVTLTPHHEAKQTILNGYYDCVINCAGVTGTPNVDACEDDKQHTIEGNAIFPAMRVKKMELNSHIFLVDAYMRAQ